MEARLHGAARSVAIVVVCFFESTLFGAAGYRTQNFTVDAPTPQLAKEIGDAAEEWRKQLSQEWLGYALPNWPQPCPIKAQVAPGMGAGGATSFVFEGGEVFGWRMNIQGSRERVLDSVLPHEITHTIFASHFRQPLPRWADEGACTTVEHRSEIAKQERMLIDFLQHNRGIAFDRMFAMTEYPQDVLPLYAQGHSLAQFLIYQRGKREFLAFMADGLRDGNWPRALHQKYGYRNLLVLQNSWLSWVKQGRPALELASNVQGATPRNVVRGQDPAGTRQEPAEISSDSKSNPWASATQGSPVTPTPKSGTAPIEWPAQQSEVAAASPAQTTEPSIYEALSREVLRR